MISMGYAALNKNLSISGEAFLRSRGNVRITGIKMNTTESDGNFTYNPEYSKRGTKVFSILPNIDSKINYTVQMNNTTGVKYKFDSVTVSNTNPNIECIPSVEVGTIIEVGVSSFDIEVKYKDGITIDEKTDICEIKYEFSVYDVTPPTIRIETITDGETSKTVKITAVDDEEGSGLSEENNYKYYLSTSNIELTGGEWKDYTNKEEFTIEGKNQTKYLWIYPVQDKAGNISDDKTGITESYFLQEYNFISTYTVSYIGNKFSTTAKVENGVTVTYDQDTSILTLNGNPTNDIVNLMLLNQTFNENDQFKITLDYISGTFTSSGEFTFSGEVVIATDIKNSSNENVSTRNWADIFLPTATISNPSGILTTTSIGANEGSYLSVMLWMKSPSTTTFTNYKVKVNITKVDTKRVKYNHAYGTLGDTPTREGYTFDGWYTKEIGGTKVTSDTIVSAEGDHTLYAHWVSSKPTYTYTGSSQLIDDGNGNWRIKFLTSGMLTLNDSLELDIFLVGGGSSSDFITGGTGGQTLTKTRNIAAGTYEIVIGNGGAEVKNSDGYYSSRRGENTTAFGITAEGGSLGGGTGSGGGCGNSAGSGYGGAGGSDGNAGGPTTGGNTCTVGRRGQGYTTREFSEPDGKLYAGGGGGYGASGSGAGGSGGGGNSGVRGEANTGGGGGAVYSTHYRTVAGGSGIVIIRNSRGKQAFDYDYTGRSILIDEGNGNWKLKFLTSGTLTTYENANIDVFLVGGGSSSEFITGGSGGQTLTESTSLPISSYDIVIGAGGTGKADGDGYYKSSSGGSSSAFGFTAIGGKPSGGTGSGGGCGNSAGSGYGGAGGSDGGAGGPTKGGNTCTVGRRGQGTTTREFGEPDGKLYAGGGGGFGVSGSGAGGAGGGGKGGSTGEINTGGGGGAVYSSKYRCVAGGSGIVIIRNQR